MPEAHTTLNPDTMFTIDQISAAHSKVRSGADFPAYIRDLIALGVTGYVTHVSDGHTDYEGSGTFRISSPAKYDPLDLADTCRIDDFRADLLAHQQGKTDYPTFITDCARSGIHSWRVDMAAKTCTYLDREGKDVLVEGIPV